MKSMFTLLTIVFLSLTLMACTSAPDAQGQSQGSRDNSSTFSQVTLEVSTIT